MSATVLRGDARNLPLPDESVDLIVTSPPYFGLRSYQDGGEHYDGQIGADAIRTNQPGYIPRAPQPMSVQARANRADALAAVDQVVECGCGSGARAGRCPECRLEQTDPMKVLAIRVQRVIERVRAERTAERDARYEAWRAAHPAEPEQLTIGGGV